MTSIPTRQLSAAHRFYRRITGIWTLIDYRTHGSNNQPVQFPLGPNAQGMLCYTPDGFILNPEPVQVHSASNLELVEAARHSLAYAGHYGISQAEHSNPDSAVIGHRIAISSVPSFIGTVQERVARIEDGNLVLTTKGPVKIGDYVTRGVLTWRRATQDEGELSDLLSRF